MTHLPGSALEHLRTHHGVASIDALLRHGVTIHGVRRLRESGQIVQVLEGVYHHRLVPFDEPARCVAVCSAHPEAVISAVTAGRLWGFRRLPRDNRIHGLFPPASQPTLASWVVPYRTSAFQDDDVVERTDGITLTSRARTAFDLARHLPDTNLLSVMEQAMHDGHFGPDVLWTVAEPWLSPRRPWARRFVGLLSRRIDGAGAESHPEVLVGSALVSAGVRGLHRQHCIDLPGYGRARFDLAIPDLRWAIEVDAHPTHRETAGAASDERRDLAATHIGWTVTRLGPEQLTSLAATAASLAARYRDLRRTTVPHR